MTLSAQNLSFSYDRKIPVLKDVSFSVDKGAFIGIFGPNGGGKTTLLRLLLSLLDPTEGDVQVMGKKPAEVSEKIGYVPQIRRFDRHFPITVLDVVMQGCLSKYKGWGGFSSEAKRDAREALEKVGMQEKASSPFGTLSGGQIQRTLIARALASRPEVLLLDEATVGIDPQGLEEILQFLIQLKQETTIVMVTHELQAVAQEMDSLLCVQQTISTFTPKQVCGHFAMGLYHPPTGGKGD